MNRGFPDRIKKYKIKWYIGPGNYGPILSDAVTYLAISVENEQNSTILLFLNKKLEVLTVLKCETEQDAFDTVAIPDDATWIRIENSEQQKKYNRMYFLRSLLNKLSTIKVEVILISTIVFLLSGWFPSYGKYVLLFEMLRFVSLFCIHCALLRIAFAACKVHGKDRKIGFVCTRIIFLLLVFAAVFIGKYIVSGGVDFFVGTKDIYLTSTSYHREDFRRSLDGDYVSGMYNNQHYSLNVAGCNLSLLYDIEDTHPVVRVTMYEHTKAVVKLEIVDEIVE